MPMPHDTVSARHFAVVPAAGIGSRVGTGLPKQYLPIDDRSVIEHAIGALLAARWIERVVVVIAPGDDRAVQLPGLRHERVEVVAAGGATRRESVLGGLRWLADRADARAADWVLVHDAARPGLDAEALERLRAALSDAPQGALLALPVADTVKLSEGARISRTLSRDGLWLAQTPQAFRLEALVAALGRHADVTDEAAAIEADGGRPLLVAGARRNFKITTAEDLDMMRALLAGARR
jgi:2-C-methyl-D-erythritol 4-phosphate cytidylyltransferase